MTAPEPYHNTHIVLPGVPPGEQYATFSSFRNQELYYSPLIFVMSNVIRRRLCSVARNCSSSAASSHVALRSLARAVSPAPSSRGAA